MIKERYIIHLPLKCIYCKKEGKDIIIKRVVKPLFKKAIRTNRIYKGEESFFCIISLCKDHLKRGKK